MTARRRWPFLGDALAFRADVTGFLSSIAGEQGDIGHFLIGRRDAYLLTHPDLVRTVLVERAEEFHKGLLLQRARRLLGNGLLTSEGEFHRTQRRRIQPAFTKEQLRRCVASAAPTVAARVDRWDGATVSTTDEMDAIAMSVVSRALLGTAIESVEPRLHASLRLLSRWAPLLVLPGGSLLEKARGPLIGRFRAALEIVERAIMRCIGANSPDAPLLAAIRSSGDSVMSPKQTRDEVMTIFLAGHDTTAATLIWIWLLLAEHPDAEQQLHNELARELGDRDLTTEDIPRLRWTAQLIDETLRLYPPVGRIGRRPVHDVTLSGVTLPANASVFLSPYVTHRDPRWYPDPDRFIPERWAAEQPGRPRFAWFPFGAGPRSCVGEHFARMVLVLTVATIARRWQLRPVVPGVPAPRSLLTVKPRRTVWMAIHRRAGYAETGT